jgi:hypothetical protein
MHHSTRSLSPFEELLAAADFVVYGILGNAFQKSYLSIISRVRPLSILERFLSYSLVSWILFGLVLLPLFGASLFGVASVGAGPSSIWLFPLSRYPF